MVDRFDDVIKQGNVFLISCGTVKPAKENKFNQTNIDMTLVFDKGTKIEPVHDDELINTTGAGNTLTFTSISEIKQLKTGTYIDVIGVVINAGKRGSVPGAGGGSIVRRNVMIADDSQYTIIIGFWGEEACNWDLEVGSTILCVKNC